MQKRDLIKTIVLIFSIIAVTVGSALALNLVTGPKILQDEADRLAAEEAKKAGVYAAVLPGGEGFEEITDTLTIDPASGVTNVFKTSNNVGYVFVAQKKGATMMKDVVIVTVGVDKSGKITGIQEKFANNADYKVNSATMGSFIGKDSTLDGIVITAEATISSNTIKEAVAAGFQVLAANKLMTAAKLTTEQVFERNLAEKITNYVVGADLTPTGNIYKAFATLNQSAIVCYVEVEGNKYLAISNTSGVVTVYEAELLDEDSQTYQLNDVTATKEAVVSEVSAFAKAEAAKIVDSKGATLTTKVTELFPEATNIQAIVLSGVSTLVDAVSFNVGEATYYAYIGKSYSFNNGVLEAYVVLDSEGKIVKVDIIEFFFEDEHFYGKPAYTEGKYTGGLTDLTGSTMAEEWLIAKATMSSTAVKNILTDSFAEFAKGGNE